MKITRLLYLWFVVFAAMVLLGSCCEEVPVVRNKRTALLYLVNRNNLQAELSVNKRQALEYMNGVNCEEQQLYLFEYSATDGYVLYRAVKNKSGKAQYIKVKEYGTDLQAVDSVRVHEVLTDVADLTPGSERTLFFGGHGFSWWNMDFLYKAPPLKAFGGEETTGRTKSIDIDCLARAIPAKAYSTIWFDACYMGGIEVAYELSDRCDKLVAYPTEVYGDGVPYNIVLPYILGENADLKRACEEFFEYYKKSNDAATVALLDMSKIREVARVSRQILKGTALRPSVYAIQNYSRIYSPFYDMGQYMVETTKLASMTTDETEFRRAMGEFILFSKLSALDFNGRPIQTDQCMGISMHHFRSLSTAADQYYRRLRWYQDVYK